MASMLYFCNTFLTFSPGGFSRCLPNPRSKQEKVGSLRNVNREHSHSNLLHHARFSFRRRAANFLGGLHVAGPTSAHGFPHQDTFVLDSFQFKSLAFPRMRTITGGHGSCHDPYFFIQIPAAYVNLLVGDV